MQLGIRCVLGNVPHPVCRDCSLSPLHPCEYPPDFLEAIRNEKDVERTEFTPSTLLECDRRSVLSRTHDHYIDVDSAMNMFRGTIFHAGIDATTKYPEAVEVIREIRLKTMVDTCYGPQLFSGKADVVVVKEIRDGVAYCKVVDYKTKKSLDHSLTSADRKHQMQINMYAWLVRVAMRNHIYNPPRPVDNWYVDELEIVYLDMKKVRRFTSAGPLEARGKRTSINPLTYETLQLEPINLLPGSTVGKWVASRIEEKIRAKEVLPPILEGDAAWVCTYCAVRDRCMEVGNV